MKTQASKYVAAAVTAFLFVAGAAHADNKSKAAAPAKAPPAKPASKPAAGGAGNAAHGPTTTSRRPGSGITTSGRRTPATTDGRPTTARPGAFTTAGRGGPNAAAGPRSANGGIPRGSAMSATRTGDQIRMRPGGRPGDVHVANRNMDIHHGLGGARSVRVERADHSRVFAEHGRRGYVQHPYMFRGHEYGHRTYWAHGRAYDRYYARYPYHGVFVEMYSPVYYYPPSFYGWAYNPWGAPVVYPVAAWGWAGAPWYGYYGPYFAPYSEYASASLWLTDYLISSSLAAAYEANADAAAIQTPLAADAAPLTRQVKDLVAAEVQRQIAVENFEATPAQQAAGPNPEISGVQRMLSDNIAHIFVAGAPLDVVDSTGAECAISEGDVLQLTPTPLPADATAATLVMKSSKGGVECHQGSAVTVSIVDLQDMQNHLRETVDQGMGDLRAKQGQGGLPVVPSSANGLEAKALFAIDAPPPDPTASDQIAQQAQEADRAEQEVLAQAKGQEPPPSVAPPPPPPTEIAPGETVDQVTAAMGQPAHIVDLGPNKKIFIYPELKITFKDGKAATIE